MMTDTTSTTHEHDWEHNWDGKVECSICGTDGWDWSVERIRVLSLALKEALDIATACAPADRLQELKPLWAILDRP